MLAEEKKETIRELLNRNILVTPKILQELENSEDKEFFLESLQKEKPQPEKKTEIKPLENQPTEDNVKILFNYKLKPQKREIKDSVQYFKKRYNYFKTLLMKKQELQQYRTLSINKINQATETIAIIGMIEDKKETKNNNILLSVEDLTGNINCIINKNNAETFKDSKELLLDEVVVLIGTYHNGFFFTEKILFPEIPNLPQKKAPTEKYVAFLSDIHVGSKQFLKEEFETFLKWIRGESGSKEQREIAKKTKYLIISGDIVDGIGIYIDQRDQLEIRSLRKQYEAFAEYLEQIPSNIKIILSPGNHDGVQVFEPQEALGENFSESLKKFPNVINVSNPALVNIDSSKNFDGFNILVYHGYSFDECINQIDSVRLNGAYDSPDLIMKALLRKRHIGPQHGSALAIHTSTEDNLIIDPIPDIFLTGHVHRTKVSSYKNVLLVNASCWQSLTPFQEKMGHIPNPAQVPILNLKTRKIKILKFLKGDQNASSE